MRGQRTHTNARTRKGPRKGVMVKKKPDRVRRPPRRRRRRQEHEAWLSAAKPAPRKKGGKKRERREVRTGVAHVQATFNNTIVTLTDKMGNVVSWSSAGSAGFKGSRKSTPFAAQTAAEIAARKAMEFGLKQIEVFVDSLKLDDAVACIQSRFGQASKQPLIGGKRHAEKYV